VWSLSGTRRLKTVGEQKNVIQGKMEIAGIIGPVWTMGWLFTIGFAGLPFSKIVLGLLLWPYYLGAALR
jgi:hypothetical protein